MSRRLEKKMEETLTCKVENQGCLWVKTVSLVLRLFDHEELGSGKLRKKKEINFRHMERAMLLYRVKKALKGFKCQ